MTSGGKFVSQQSQIGNHTAYWLPPGGTGLIGPFVSGIVKLRHYQNRVFLRTRLLRLIINDFAYLEIGDRVVANNLWRFGDERAKTSL